jgi:hypothetical protein
VLATAGNCGQQQLAENITDDHDELWFAARRYLRAKMSLFARALQPSGCSDLTVAAVA